VTLTASYHTLILDGSVGMDVLFILFIISSIITSILMQQAGLSRLEYVN
jgi:hypothetical protein